jgi:hypothetical protein
MSIGGDLPCLIKGDFNNPEYRQSRHWFEAKFVLNCHESTQRSRQMPISCATVASVPPYWEKILPNQGLAATLPRRNEPVFPPTDCRRDH